MNLIDRVHFLHRAWRYRLNTERFAVAFLLGRDLRGKLAVDIGANHGIYSYWMHRCVGPEGRVIAFEPQPEMSAELEQLREGFRLRRLEIAGVGLSSEAGELILRRSRNHRGGASFEDSLVDRTDQEQLHVEVTTLDRYVELHAARPVAFIKCDVESHEHHVFRGGRRTLAEDRPDVLVECHTVADPDSATVQILRSVDYEGFYFLDGGLAPIADYASMRSRIHHTSRADFVFVPKERAAELSAG